MARPDFINEKSFLVIKTNYIVFLYMIISLNMLLFIFTLLQFITQNLSNLFWYSKMKLLCITDYNLFVEINNTLM